MSCKLLSIPLLALIFLNTKAASQELLLNGDFTAGNSGFSTDLVHVPGGFIYEAQYDVTTDPLLVHWAEGTYSYGDHTSGTGNMLVVNGPTISTTTIWAETVSVFEGTEYVFSGWVSSWRNGPFSNLRLSINDIPILDFWSPSTPAVWQNFETAWNSGTSTSAAIVIYDLSTDQAGNDFALDDLSFSVPEPTSSALLIGAVALAGVRRRRCS